MGKRPDDEGRELNEHDVHDENVTIARLGASNGVLSELGLPDQRAFNRQPSIVDEMVRNQDDVDYYKASFVSRLTDLLKKASEYYPQRVRAPIMPLIHALSLAIQYGDQEDSLFHSLESINAVIEYHYSKKPVDLRDVERTGRNLLNTIMQNVRLVESERENPRSASELSKLYDSYSSLFTASLEEMERNSLKADNQSRQ